jgi:hypothetical protein
MWYKLLHDLRQAPDDRASIINAFTDALPEQHRTLLAGAAGLRALIAKLDPASTVVAPPAPESPVLFNDSPVLPEPAAPGKQAYLSHLEGIRNLHSVLV